MRIAILGIRGVPTNHGGFETFAEQLGRRLVERGHEVTVYGRDRLVTRGTQEYLGTRVVRLAGTAVQVHRDVIRRGLGRAPTPRYDRFRPGVGSHIQHFDQRSIRRLLSQCGFIVDRVTVDDASPQRTRIVAIAFAARRLLSRVTPWNFGREMLVTGSRGPQAG